MPHPEHNPSWDPIGAALRDYLQGDQAAWIEVDNSVQEGERLEAAYFFRNPRKAHLVEKALLEHCEGKVLDIGAGSGIHTRFLREVGLNVTALDVSAELVEIMREQGMDDVHQANIFDWEGGPYDTLLMLMNGIGIVGDLEGLGTFLEKAKSLLVPGGQILLESTDILYAYTEESGSILVPGDHYYGEISYQMTYKGRPSPPFPWLYVDPGTLSLIAEEQGYACTILYLSEMHNYAAKLQLQS